MRNLKKFLALVLAMMMVFSLMVTVNAASSFDGYTDADKVAARYATAVEVLTNINVFHGTSGSAFSPEQTITRAEMATIVYRVMTGDVNDKNIALYKDYDNKFEDVTNEWFAPYVNYADNAGLVVGDGNGHFFPMQKINGYQVLAILLRALGYDQKGEFTGKDWDMHTAQIAAQLHITDNLNYTLRDETPRQVVAQMTYNTAVKTERRAWTPALAYQPIGETLIELNTDEQSYDDFGAPSTTYSATFTYPQVDVNVENKVADKPLAEWWTPVSQATVYTAAKLTGDPATVTTYTNGFKDTSASIDPNDTTDLIGGQGRWTRVYSDRIIYVDTFLSQVDEVVDEVKVNGKVAIDAEYTTTTYYNNYQVPTTQPIANTGYTTEINEDGTISFDEGAFFASYAIAYEDPFTGDGDGSTQGIDELVSPYAVTTRKNVTISYIVKDIDGNETGIGTNNGEYLYNCTYAYNGGSIGNNGETGRLTDTDINSTVTLYLDAKGNILGVQPAEDAGNTGVGVVVDYDAGKIKSGAWYGELTVLTEKNTKVTIKFLEDKDTDPETAQTPYTTEDGAADAAEAFMGNLIYWVSDTASAAGTPAYPGYVVIEVANSGTPVDVGGAIEIGDAEALSGASGPLLNDNTVFFVANYQMQNSKGGYVFTGYNVYTGFQNLPRDLSCSGNVVAGTNPNVNASDAATTSTLQVEYFDDEYDDSGNWADYVLVINAVNRTTNKVEPVANYVFLANPNAFVKVYDNYYQYSGIMNGKANQPFRVDYDAVDAIDETGLYIYDEYTNDGWADVELADYYKFDKDSWGYYAGVLYNDADSVVVGDGASSADTFYTVAESGVNIYIVDATDGSFVKVNASMSAVQRAYGDSDIWFQLNKYGWIDTVYVVAVETADPGEDARVITDIDLTVPAAKPTYGAAIANYTVKKTTSTDKYTVSYVWQQLIGNTWSQVQGNAFGAGTFRVVVTITANSGYVFSQGTTNYNTPTGAGASDLGLDSYTFESGWTGNSFTITGANVIVSAS